MAHVLCYDGYQELIVVKLAAVAAIQSSVVRIFAPDQLLYARVVLLGCTGVRRSSLTSFCPSGVAPGGAVYGSIHLSLRSCDSPSCCAGFILTAPEDSASRTVPHSGFEFRESPFTMSSLCHCQTIADEHIATILAPFFGYCAHPVLNPACLHPHCF